MRVAVILPLAVVTTLALTCAPQVAPATLAAIAIWRIGRLRRSPAVSLSPVSGTSAGE